MSFRPPHLAAVLLAGFAMLILCAASAPVAAAAPPLRAPGGWNPDPAKFKHPRGLVPRLGRGHVAAASANPNCGNCSPPLQFKQGSPVIGGLSGTAGHVTIAPIFWAPTGYSFSASYKSIINGYLQNVAAASGSNANVFSVGTQYYQQSTTTAPVQHVQYAVTAAAEIDDATGFPAQGGTTGCIADSGFSACVSDAELQAELRGLLGPRGLAIDDSHLYVVMLPQGVETCEGTGVASTANRCSSNAYCAYHATDGPPYLLYTNEPYPDLAHCSDPWDGGPQTPNGDAEADAQVSLISHEANESITDAFGAWMDPNGYEDGDECAYVYGAPLGGAPGSYYNQVIGGGRYFTQDEFSNEDYAGSGGDPTHTGGTQVPGCMQREELPTASFTGPTSLVIGGAATFDASSASDPDNTSALTYAWSWGDGSTPGTGRTASHAFAAAGSYTVTLTVTDADGWTRSSSGSVVVTPGPPIVTGLSPASSSAAGGIPVTISGSGFAGTAIVDFGSTAVSFTIVSDSQLNVIAPAHAAGIVDVTVTSALGTSPVTTADRFSYIPQQFISYFNWLDLATPGMTADNIHLLNTSGRTANVSVTMPGAAPISVTLAAGQETHVSFGNGHIGGPVVVTSDQQILSSQRVQYFQTFNEVWGMSAAQAATTLYLPWFDKATPGMVGDNIHVLNPGSAAANVTVSLQGTPISFALGPGQEGHVTFPAGRIGGPVIITADQPVMAAQRVQYYQSFNEEAARSAAQAQQTSYFNWFDLATPGMVGDNVHLLNPGAATANVTVTLQGIPITFALAPGQQTHISFGAGRIGGPVTVSSDQPVLATQRVQYYQSFNEVPQLAASDALGTSHIMWFDKASPGMTGDNIHLLNPNSSTVTVTVSLPGSPDVVLSVAPGSEAYATFPVGRLGGPVTISGSLPVQAAQRVQYFQSFNEVAAS